MSDAIKLAIDALEEVFVIGDRLVNDVYGYEFVEKAKAALAALRAQPDHIVDASEMVDHSELVNRLRSFDFGANDTDEWIAIMDEAADALEGKTK